MPAGIEVYNADGTLQFSMTDRLLKEYSVVILVGATTSGSVALPALSGSNSFAVSDRIQSETTYNRPSTIAISGGNVSWNYSGVPSGSRDPNYQLVLELY